MNKGSFMRRIKISDFSPREVDVLRLIGLGLSTKEIANYLGIAYKTADYYRDKIMKKCGVRNVVHAVHCAIRLGLINWEELTGRDIELAELIPEGEE